MKRLWMFAAVAACLAAGDAFAQTSVGVGARYFKTVDSLDGPFEEDGLAPLLTIKRDFVPLIHGQLDFVLYPDGYAGSDKDVFAPEVFLIVGSGIYAGLGVGTLYSDGEFGDPFFIARAGLDLELLPSIHLDLNANYEFAEWEQINTIDKDADSDTITLGAALRIEL